VLQNLGTEKKPCGHWYSLFLNFEKKRFEVLDSARGPDDESLINHSRDLVDAIKCMYRINYSSSSKQIDDYELVFIEAPKQNNKYVLFFLSNLCFVSLLDISLYLIAHRSFFCIFFFEALIVVILCSSSLNFGMAVLYLLSLMIRYQNLGRS
jgi:hypothetical protein